MYASYFNLPYLLLFQFATYTWQKEVIMESNVFTYMEYQY